ncbi:MAG: LacI family DNA-binding transcriptional regulator [Austwickia sp.]|nr:LacI family DNA-binding transcriptional regulator [Austwickia sp.]
MSPPGARPEAPGVRHRSPNGQLAAPRTLRGLFARVRRGRSTCCPHGCPGRDASDWTIDRRRSRRPTGFICADDVLAVALMAALRQKGMSVPDDLAVVGWGDAPMSRHSWPSLTTVRPPFAELGRTAAGRLQDRIRSGPPLDHPILLTHTLVLRASCGCPHP